MLAAEINNLVDDYADRTPDKLSPEIAVMTIGVPLYERVTDLQFRALAMAMLRQMIIEAVEEKKL